jgi:acetyl esterase/lipase
VADDPVAPLLAPARAGWRRRLAAAVLPSALRASLVVSPRPAALLVRHVFAKGGAATAERLRAHAPADVVTHADERYGDEPEMLLDVHRPAAADGPLPLLVWVHGGAWVGGSKEEVAGWCRVIAAHGYTVVAPRYGLAPERRYPTPPRHVMAALAHATAHAGRLAIDPTRIALGGDSAGAQIAAQLGAVVTTPGYAGAVGIAPAIEPDQLRALVLACGPYDLALASAIASPAGRRLVRAVLWAYSGHRRYAGDRTFGLASVVHHVTPAFPPALVTVGNADPLRPHSEALVARLRAVGADVEAVFFPDDHEPPLGHEYQFDLDGEAGQRFLERLLAFVRERLV